MNESLNNLHNGFLKFLTSLLAVSVLQPPNSLYRSPCTFRSSPARHYDRETWVEGRMYSAATCEIVPTVLAPTDCRDFRMHHLRIWIFDRCNSVVSLCLLNPPREWSSDDIEIQTCQLLSPKPEPIDGARSPVSFGDQALGRDGFPCFLG